MRIAAEPCRRYLRLCALLVLGTLVGSGVGGCATTPAPDAAEAPPIPPGKLAYATRDRDCLVRAMYFEANRSSDDGLLALGSVVMNRVNSGIFPNTICGVVGEPGQFAAGVLTRPMQESELQRVENVADQVLDGKRHPRIANAMYFHMAGLHFHYPNMHYVLVAGGNAFYERKRREKHGPSLSADGSAPSQPDDFTEDNHFAFDASPVTPVAMAGPVVSGTGASSSRLKDLSGDHHFASEARPATLSATAGSPVPRAGSSSPEPDDLTEDNRFALDTSALTPAATASSPARPN